jgi:hypothetical protein
MIRADMRFLDGRDGMECIITDISATGALIEIGTDDFIPDDFDLYIPARSETKIAKIRRRDGRRMGVEFLRSRHDDPKLTASILQRLARLERELSALKSGAETWRSATQAATAAGDSDLPARMTAIETELPHLRMALEKMQSGAAPGPSAEIAELRASLQTLILLVAQSFAQAQAA